MSDVQNADNAASTPVAGGANAGYNGLAIASLILGLLGIFNFGATSLIGLILGIIGKKQIKDNPEKYKGDGMALGGIISSAVCMAIGIIVGIIYIAVFAVAVAAEM